MKGLSSVHYVFIMCGIVALLAFFFFGTVSYGIEVQFLSCINLNIRIFCLKFPEQ